MDSAASRGMDPISFTTIVILERNRGIELGSEKSYRFQSRNERAERNA